MAKYIVDVSVTFHHSYVVEADSAEEAELKTEEKDVSIDFFEDDSETSYSAREWEDEDLSLYDRI